MKVLVVCALFVLSGESLRLPDYPDRYAWYTFK